MPFSSCSFFFKKDAYYHLGNYETESNLRMMIIRAWYSALRLDLEDYPGLVHYPENCRYILDKNDFRFKEERNNILNRLDYFQKLIKKFMMIMTKILDAFGDNVFNNGLSDG